MEESIGSRVARQPPVDATTKALSIAEIRKIIVDYAMWPYRMSSFCRLRAVNHSWKETAFDVMRDQNSNRFRLSLTRSQTLKTEQFCEKLTSDTVLPLVLILKINDFDDKLASRLARDYSHIVVRLDLSINSGEGPLSGLDRKLEVFQGRAFSGLKTVNVRVSLSGHPKRYTLHEIEKCLDAVEKFTRGLLNLKKFKITLSCDSAKVAQLDLPNGVTHISLCGWSAFLIVHPRNRFPGLKVLEINSGKRLGPKATVNVQTQWGNFLKHHTKLEKLKMVELPVRLPVPWLNSLKEVTLKGINFALGSGDLPNLTMFNLCIGRNPEGQELTELVALGRVARNASYVTLRVNNNECPSAPLRMDLLCEAFSNVTRLELRSYSGWEKPELSLAHVYVHMTALQELDISVTGQSWAYLEIDLCYVLTRYKESQLAEKGKEKILHGRRDAITNLRRLRSLRINTDEHLKQLHPVLFQAVFLQMPELTKITLSSRYLYPYKCIYIFAKVMEMVTAWRAVGKDITYNFGPRKPSISTGLYTQRRRRIRR